MIENILRSLDIKDEEIRAYMVLLESPAPRAVGHLSKQLGIARASLYGMLEKLHNKGLVKQSLQDGVKVFCAEAPEKIDLLFKNQIGALEESRLDFQSILPSLKNMAGLSMVSPRFSFFEGIEGVKYILNDMLMYRDLQTSSLWPIKEMMDILSPEFFLYHNTQRIQNNICVRALWPKNRIVNIKQHPFMGEGDGFLREIRLVPDTLDYTMGYWIYKNKVAFLSSRRESFGFIIESDEFARTTQTQFDFIWSQSQKVKAQSAETEQFLRGLK